MESAAGALLALRDNLSLLQLGSPDPVFRRGGRKPGKRRESPGVRDCWSASGFPGRYILVFEHHILRRVRGGSGQERAKLSRSDGLVKASVVGLSLGS